MIYIKKLYHDIYKEAISWYIKKLYHDIYEEAMSWYI